VTRSVPLVLVAALVALLAGIGALVIAVHLALQTL
jgi:ABC-type phosphate/phosphonate transport system permease subunit